MSHRVSQKGVRMSRVSAVLLGVLAGLAGLSCKAEEPSPAREEPRDAGTPPAEDTAAAARALASLGADVPVAHWPGPSDSTDEGTFACDLQKGMTPPELLSGSEVRYPPEALRARVSGVVVARCTLTQEGKVEGCRILKGLPHLNEAVIQALQSRRYRPVTFQGKPITTPYTFSMRLPAP
jgi:TonB family protein